jgi:hypothetical protein
MPHGCQRSKVLAPDLNNITRRAKIAMGRGVWSERLRMTGPIIPTLRYYREVVAVGGWELKRQRPAKDGPPYPRQKKRGQHVVLTLPNAGGEFFSLLCKEDFSLEKTA